jgi:DNA-directed RNA polymerase specialized sigma24 family protein
MIPAKIDSVAAATIREKGSESVVDWFERNLESFYSLGWFYLHDEAQMEELFYRSILKVHKGLPRFKSEMSLDMWVTSIFIDNCRELFQAGELQVSHGNQDVFTALDQLEAAQKEAMLLIYVKGFSQEEAAQILRVSMDKMKELLYSGIESVREQLTGLTYNGCKEYRKNYLDYLEKSMARPEKIEFEKHIYHCHDCQEDLASFQEVAVSRLSFAESMNDLQVPPHFMETIKLRLMEKKKHSKQKNKKHMKLALLFASVFAFVTAIGIFTGAFSYAYYGLTEEDEQLRMFLQKDLGQRVNLEAESDGVKINITGVVADDFQTLVFYKIEDTGDGNQYYVNHGDGLIVENDSEIMNQVSFPRFQLPDLKAEMNKKNKNVFYGKIGLLPLNTEKGTMDIKINRLIRLNQDASDPIGLSFRNTEFKEGDWEFKVPVTKQPSIEYTLDDQTEIEGVPVRFNRLTIAPTATILDYGINIGNPEKRIDFLNFGDLVVNDEKLKADMFGSDFTTSYQDVNWNSFQVRFDTLYGEKPEEIKVHFKSANLAFEDDKSVELDVTKHFPQTFEYAGSTISIDKVDVGEFETTIVISDHEIKNRAYEMFHVNMKGENENEHFSMSMDSEGVFVDRNGVEFDPATTPFDYENPDQPRHFVTEQTIRLGGYKVIPKRIDITGYSTTRYLNNIVEISVE